MPHVSAGSSSGASGSAVGGASSSSGGGGSGPSSSARIRDDPNDCDEVKVFKCAEDEGEGDSDDVIDDDKRELINECDQKGRLSPLSPPFSVGHSSGYSSSKNGHATIRPDPASIFGKTLEGVAHPSPLNMGYLMPYPYSNGSPLSTMAEKMRLNPFFCNGVEGLTQPPPAHMGYHGLSRTPMYPFVQYPYSGLPEVSQVAQWHAQNMYPISNAGSPAGSAGFRNYPPTLSIPPTSLPGDFYSRFSPGALLQGSGLPPHPGLGHHLVGTPSKHDAHHSSHLDHNHRNNFEQLVYNNGAQLMDFAFNNNNMQQPQSPLPGRRFSAPGTFCETIMAIANLNTQMDVVIEARKEYERQRDKAIFLAYQEREASLSLQMEQNVMWSQGQFYNQEQPPCSYQEQDISSPMVVTDENLNAQEEQSNYYGEDIDVETPDVNMDITPIKSLFDPDVGLEAFQLMNVEEFDASLVCQVEMDPSTPIAKSADWWMNSPPLQTTPREELNNAYPNAKSEGSSLSDQKSSDTHGSKHASDSGQSSNSQNEKKKPHIKKPLNAFMLYMKEMRAKVVAECTLKESAAINQILGRRWHSLSREEQSKYYELARQERQLHMQLYPGWSARDNYGYGAKKKKRKKEKTSDGGREEQAKYYELARRERQLHMQMYPNWSSAQNRTHHEKKRKKKQDQKFDGGNSMKKCRARYGLDQQSQWCKPCRRKKKCIRYLEEANNGSGTNVNSPDDNLGSAGSAGEPLSPDSKNGDSDMDKSSDMGMSSPGFSLTSPGMSLASPGMSLPSPAMTSPSGVLPSPASLASPAVSLPSLQSPMTPSMCEDRHPISSVSSSASSIGVGGPFTTTTTSSNHNSNLNSTSTSTSHHHQNSSSSSSRENSRNHTNSSPSSSSYNKHGGNNHHHPHLPNNMHHHHNMHSSPQFGFGLSHLFAGGGGGPGGANGGSPNGGIPGLPVGGLPFPFPLGLQKPHRNPVGANPHDINNPLSVNQLTGQCNSSASSSSSSASSLSSASERSSSQRSTTHSNHHNNNNNHHHHHHRTERSRSRDRHNQEGGNRMDQNEKISDTGSSGKGSSNNNTTAPPPVPAPVIGVS